MTLSHTHRSLHHKAAALKYQRLQSFSPYTFPTYSFCIHFLLIHFVYIPTYSSVYISCLCILYTFPAYSFCIHFLLIHFVYISYLFILYTFPTYSFLSRISTLTRDIRAAILSARQSIHDVPVLDENGLTYCHTFFTIW